jgi:hypothetical protein
LTRENFKISHGLSSRHLAQECASRFDMAPASTRDIAESLYELGAISFPRTQDRYIYDDWHEDGPETLAALALLSADWKTLVGNADPAYWSDVWRDEEYALFDSGAIRPHSVERYDELSQEQRNVFSVIAEHYIALFDPARSIALGATEGGVEAEMRRFSAAKHKIVEDVFGHQTDIFGPDFYVDNRHEGLFLAVDDDVSEVAWLEVPLGVFSDYLTRLPFSSPADFARSNMPFLRRFADEANEIVLSEGRGLYVCAPDTYEIRNGQRHYLWPRD